VSNVCPSSADDVAPANDPSALMKEYVMSLDFIRFEKRLMKDHAEFENDLELVQSTIEEYKKFLYLNWKYPGAFSPSILVDLVWHIL
jgi:hypothetical protein